MKRNNPLKKEKISDDEKVLFLSVITMMIILFFGLYIRPYITEVDNEIRRININSILTGKEVKNCSMAKEFKLDMNFCHIKGSRELSHE